MVQVGKVHDTSSAPSLENLRGFSAAAHRWVGFHPRWQKYLSERPQPARLLRLVSQPAQLVENCIRLMRRRIFVHTAARESLGESPLETARLWSEFADVALHLVDHIAYRELSEKHGPPRTESGRDIGRAIFALGKLGSLELNPSSDIDVLFCYECDDGSWGPHTPHEAFTRWARRVREMLARVTPDGFAFRVDLDLRPEGTTGPLVNSIDALERYYETFGMTWERAALLRMRAIVSTEEVGEEVQRRLRPFLFPRIHDLRAVDELADMKNRVTAAATQDGFDVKRGKGGIREVEFIAQVLQLLHGGRIPEIRFGSTVEVLYELERYGLLPYRIARELSEGYEFLRRVEHALQYWEDRQTQVLPTEEDTRSGIREALGNAVPDLFRAESFDDVLDAHRQRIHRAFQSMLGEARDIPSEAARLALVRKSSDTQRESALANLGFAQPEEALRCVRSLEKRSLSPFSPRARARPAPVSALAAHLLDDAAESPDPDASLFRMTDLFSGYVPGSLERHLAEDKRLRSLLTRVLAVSAPLSRLLSRHAALESALLSGQYARRLSVPSLLQALREDIDPEDDEARLIRMRRIHGRHTLALGVAFLGGRKDIIETGHELALLADALVLEAYSIARHKIARRFGEPEHARFSVCALGRWGGRELGFLADLDVLFIYDAQGMTSGPKSISAGEWAARLAQQVIWMLSASLAEGRCYEVDTRLRPSGNQGPLVTHLNSFRKYHELDAALWERQSLLRFRPVVGPVDFRMHLTRQVREIIRGKHPSELGGQLLSMVDRIQRERSKNAPTRLDLKLGSGGLMDIDFAVQGLQLAFGSQFPAILSPSLRRTLRRLVQLGLIPAGTGEQLRRHYDRLSALREALVLTDDRRIHWVNRDDRRLHLLATAHPIVTEIAPDAESGEEIFDALRQAADRVHDDVRALLSKL